MKKTLLAIVLGLATMQTARAVEYQDWVQWDEIQHWAGDPDGEKKCALVIDFQDGNPAFVWGYRWNGTATGEDLVRAVASQSSILTAMIQYTGTMGSTLNGLGVSMNREELDYLHYDFDNAAIGGEVSFGYFSPNTSMGQEVAPGYEAENMCIEAIERAKETGIIEHPLNAFFYGYPAYDYDYWQLEEDYRESYEYRWRAGWYDGYWSYWHGPNDYDYMGYSGLGMSSTVLVDGGVQAWKYIVFNGGGGYGDAGGDLTEELDYVMADYTEEMHEAVVPVQPVDQANVNFWVGTGEKAATVVFQFNDGKGPENLVYGYRWSGGWDDDLATVVTNIAKADPRMTFTKAGSSFTLTYDSNDDGALGTIDHTDIENTWNCYVKRVIDDGFNKIPAGRWLNPNAVFIFSHQAPEVAEVQLPYQLFRPALDSENIITIPDVMEYALADENIQIPLFIQRPENSKVNTAFNWTRDAAITAVTTSMGTTNLMGKINDFKNFKETTGTVKVRGSYTPDGGRATYVYSNDMTLSLKAPLRPVTAIRYESDNVSARLKHPVDNNLVFEPADATYTKMTYASSQRTVATVATTGIVTTTTTAGHSTITATYAFDNGVTASYNVNSSLLYAVEDITFEDADENGVITLTPKQMTGLIPIFTPADPDISDVTITLSDNGTSKENYIATMYTVNFWPDGKTMTRFNELSGHRVGTCLLTVEAKDGSGLSKTFTVNVVEPDREPAIDYTEGTIMLNEEWFGHTNGGLNWYSPDYDIVYQAYERENPGMSFGCTSQYGIIYDGKLIVSSKQAADGGDPLPGGGRLVVADANTLKRLGSIDDILFGDETKSGDGRALCGAGPGRVYMGTNKGIYVIDTDNFEVTGKISGTDPNGNTGSGGSDIATDQSLYNGQIGDMVLARDKVYAICQDKGVFIIDIDTDYVVKTIDDKNVQGITQSADGTVWYATIDDNKCSNFVALDINTLEEIDRVVVPADLGTVNCGWGAWRTTQFTGAQTVNSLFFAPGASISNGGSGVYYRYDIDTQKFTHIITVADMGAHTPGISQAAYGTIRYDDRTGNLIVGTTEFKASGHYRYNWTHFVDATTGEIVKTIELRPYYWFQSMPIFPDRHDVVLDLDNINAYLGNDTIVDLSEVADDADNHNANIRFSLAEAEAAAESDETEQSAAEVSLDGHILTIHPVSVGDHYFTLMAESNGRTVSKTVAVNIGVSGVEDVVTGGSISCDGTTLLIRDFNGVTFSVYDMNGRHLTDIEVDDDIYRARLGVADGVYVLRGTNGVNAKFILNR